MEELQYLLESKPHFFSPQLMVLKIGHGIESKGKNFVGCSIWRNFGFISAYVHQQKRKRNKINNFGCSFSEAEKYASDFLMWKLSVDDVRACRFAYVIAGQVSRSVRLIQRIIAVRSFAG
ncbi:hypothetical protein TNCV_4129871 [Trichonephila clavipes]|nr:hypothetical protein TNCV_4129871 [Trichonephila clavipes]